jgi:radical SAM enzyme (TIGR01210 family)
MTRKSNPKAGALRPARTAADGSAHPPQDPWRAQAFFVEEERSLTGQIVPVLTVLLTGRECPWRCVMCDLWRFTTPTPVPPGAVPAQLEQVLAEQDREHGAGGTGPVPAASTAPATPHRRQIKLYNSGSFFDPGSVPPSDYEAIARLVRGFERVIVECHPALVNDRCLRFQEALERVAPENPIAPRAPPQLEVALGFETVDTRTLQQLNKRMTLGSLERAARWLAAHQVALRAFVLVQPPFQPPDQAIRWAERSAVFAFDCGATVVSLIPTRSSHGTLAALAAQGRFVPPRLATLEAAQERGLALGRGRVFADLWDLESFSDCPACFARRRERLRRMNLDQVILPAVVCGSCRSGPRQVCLEHERTPLPTDCVAGDAGP